MPVIPRIGPSPVVPLRRVAPQDVGSGAGDLAYGDAASTLASAEASIALAEQAGNVARGVAGASTRIDEFRMEVDQYPDHTTREQKFQEGRQKIVKEFRDQIKGGAAQRDFDLRVTPIGDRQRLAIRQGVTARRLDIAHGDAMRAVESIYRQAAAAENDTDKAGFLKEAATTLDRAESTGAITAVQKADALIRQDRQLRDSDNRRTSQRTATQIFESHATPEARIAAAREQLGDGDPLLLDRTVAKLKDMNAEEATARADSDRKLTNDLVRQAYDGELTHEMLVGAEIPAGLRSSLESVLSQREASAVRGSPEVRTDRRVLNEIRSVLRDPNQRARARALDLSEFSEFLSKADQESLAQEQMKPDPGLAEIEKQTARFEKLLFDRRMPRTAEDQQLAIDYRDAVDQALERKRQSLGRKYLSDDEVEDVLKGQLRSYVRDNWFKDDRVRRFETIVPRADSERLRSKLEALGVENPTIDDVTEAYLDEQGFKPEAQE